MRPRSRTRRGGRSAPRAPGCVGGDAALAGWLVRRRQRGHRVFACGRPISTSTPSRTRGTGSCTASPRRRTGSGSTGSCRTRRNRPPASPARNYGGGLPGPPHLSLVWNWPGTATSCQGRAVIFGRSMSRLRNEDVRQEQLPRLPIPCHLAPRKGAGHLPFLPNSTDVGDHSEPADGHQSGTRVQGHACLRR